MTLRASEYAHDGFASDGVLNERRNGERALRRTILLVEMIRLCGRRLAPF